MLKISNALRGVCLMFATACAVSTSNLQEDGVYEMQFAQDEFGTVLAQTETELGVAAPLCVNPDGSPILCGENFDLNLYNCNCECNIDQANDSCVPPLVLDI